MMKKQWDGQAVPGGGPDEAALALINRHARTPLTAAQVYCFAVRLCDNDIDRDCERFSDEALTQMAPLFEGKAGLFDHQWSARQQVARLYRTEVAGEEGQLTGDGRPCVYLKGYAYMLRSAASDPLIADIEGGIKREVSVGLSCARSTCSVCGQPVGSCSHEKGKTYDGALCHTVLEQPTDAYEWSFVAVPAQPAAGVIKSIRQGARAPGPKPEAHGEAVQKEAELGRLFVKELGSEVCRLGALCDLPAEVAGVLGARLAAQELIVLRDALRKAVAKRYPESPQLGSGLRTKAARETPEFMI